MKLLKNISRAIFRKENIIFVSFFLGITSFLLIYGLEPLRYTGTGWIVNGFGGKDITQHQTGWEFYRRSPWTFPLCKALYLGYPEGTAISYTDSIPLVALLFKIISPLLPEYFQYFGLYTCFCFAMQGLFSALLLRQFTKSNLFSVIGSIPFITASCFLERCFRHTALSSHWLLLAALLLYFKRKEKPNSKKLYVFWGALLCAAIGTQPYLFVMACGVYIIFVIEDLHHHQTWIKHLYKPVSVIVVTIVFGFVLGLFGTDIESASGFGIYSLNLNALFNPNTVYFTQWSSAVEKRPLYAGQSDGIYYLGLFMIVIFILSIFIFLLDGSEKIRNKLKKYVLLIALLLSYTVFALSDIITFDDHVIFRYYLPEIVLDKINIFRASARFFFVPYYCIFIFSLVSIYRIMSGKWMSILSVMVIALIQVLEILPGINELHLYFEERKEPLFFSKDWYELSQNYDTVISFDCLTDRTLAFWLAQNNFKTNMMITAPVHLDAYWERTKQSRQLLKDNLEQGIQDLDKNTLYFISEDTGDNCTFENETELTKYINQVKEQYKNIADVMYLTDWVKNYWIIVPKS